MAILAVRDLFVGIGRILRSLISPGRRPVTAPPEKLALRRQPPESDIDSEFFWAGASAGRLVIQQCSSCGQLRHPPAPLCPHCCSAAWASAPVSGQGKLYSYVVCHHPLSPPFTKPYVVALVDLAEGVRLVSTVTDVDQSELEIGMRLQVEFTPIDDGPVLPTFRRAQDPAYEDRIFGTDLR